MQSSLIGKIQKANMYAREPERVALREIGAKFRGEHDTYDLSYRDGSWGCSCNSFPASGICSHVMAMQKLVGAMLPVEARYWPVTEPAVVANGATSA
jgi:hypothetical protein